MSKIGKRLKSAREGVDREKAYAVAEAVKVVKERAKAKFDETVEVAMNLGVDPKHADQMVRGVCNLPNGSGRTQRVAVFAKGAKAEEAKAAGADVVGAEDLVEQVSKGTINFDRCIATPDMMGLVGRLGKVLGPRGRGRLDVGNRARQQIEAASLSNGHRPGRGGDGNGRDEEDYEPVEHRRDYNDLKSATSAGDGLQAVPTQADLKTGLYRDRAPVTPARRPPRRSRRDRPGRAPSRSPRPSPSRSPAARPSAAPPAASSISRMSLRAIVSSKLALKSPRAIFSPRDLISAAGLELREHRQRVGRRDAEPLRHREHVGDAGGDHEQHRVAEDLVRRGEIALLAEVPDLAGHLLERAANRVEHRLRARTRA